MSIGDIQNGPRPPKFVARRGAASEILQRVQTLQPGQWFEWDLAEKVKQPGDENKVVYYSASQLQKNLKRMGLSTIGIERSGLAKSTIYDTRQALGSTRPAGLYMPNPTPSLAPRPTPPAPSPEVLRKQAEVERSEAAVAENRRPPGRPRKDGLPAGSVPKKPAATPIPSTPNAKWTYPGTLKPPPADPRLRDLGTTIAASRQEAP